MNKQQLANQIFQTANNLRSRIEANEYKDYILGFMFYKFLSEKELARWRELGVPEEEIQHMTEAELRDDPDTLRYTQRDLGYFIGYDNLFSTWRDSKDFSVANVRDALSAFTRLLVPIMGPDVSAEDKKKHRVFEGIFHSLSSGLSKLGDSTGAQTKAIRSLMSLIDKIPMDKRQDYDVVGFIYEYLISNFAANAGKKAGEFYTPHEVSVLMSDIVAYHLRGRENIEIYDPTSGSGSLLINIGKSVAKEMGNADKIKYYAQELKENTYNLTRMNLVMRGIDAENINARLGDTLESDWPYFDTEENRESTYRMVRVDAVVSNPPYSQNWDPQNKENDPRYADYGLAPKSKADYAFLLHDLYHLKPDGIMCIVLPHGVLFRGNEEYNIRKALIEKNQIEAVIGLPADIFFGTSIPTIIMVLKRQREDTGVLIIDASKGFEKSGKKNQLRASDIRRIVDTYKTKKDTPKYARLVSKEEIRQNDYNLNIPRYVDSSAEPPAWDLYGVMRGVIPQAELAKFADEWQALPTLKEALFTAENDAYCTCQTEDIAAAIQAHPSAKALKDQLAARFAGFDEAMQQKIVKNRQAVPVDREEETIADDIFARFAGMPLISPYDAYQELDDAWKVISADLEMIQTDDDDAVRKVQPHMVLKKKDSKEIEVQEGWEGRILPFPLVQRELLPDDLAALEDAQRHSEACETELNELLEGIDEEQLDSEAVNDDHTKFVKGGLTKEWKLLKDDLDTPAVKALCAYSSLKSKKEKTAFVTDHPEVNWAAMETTKSGTYSKAAIDKAIDALAMQAPLDEGSWPYIVRTAMQKLDEKAALDKDIKVRAAELEQKTMACIENLSDEDADRLLHDKWIAPLTGGILAMPDARLQDFAKALQQLTEKYDASLSDIEHDIEEDSESLANMLQDLEANPYDMQGLKDLQTCSRRTNNG
ncbi:type I restriction-modification system subunit M [Mitsuokella jalaludinii]|uniref:type I restriction-modification system subunit M n=1 Tax=Mitsuokella jalaludinii TaxID=187979 RepID=UPI003F9430ED